MMRCVGLEDNEHNNKKGDQADVILKQEVEGEGGVDYTEHPRDNKEEVHVMLVVALGNSDTVRIIERCRMDEKSK